jgi:hypothetical protein
LFLNNEKRCLRGYDYVAHYKNYENILKFLYANGEIVSIKGTKERKYYLTSQEIPMSIMAKATDVKVK